MRLSALVSLINCVLVHFVKFVYSYVMKQGNNLDLGGELCGKWKTLHCGT